jgi:hypothetical protein
MAHHSVASATPRPFIALLILLLIGLSGGLALAYGGSDQAATPVYTVSQIRTVLTHQAAPWIGRTVQVRGILEGSFVFCADTRPCPPATLGLIDTEDQIVGPDRYLPVTTETEATPLRLIRRIPLLSAVAPAPQPLQFGRMAIYTLHITADPVLCSRNPAVLCYKGVVLVAT